MSFLVGSILIMVLGGLTLMVIYSLLAMAAKDDEYLDQLELEQKGGNDSPSIEALSEPLWAIRF
jgi:hypothetical protein